MRRMSIALLLLALGAVGHAETWITIDDQPMRLNRSSSCKSLAKDNVRNLCDCCLVQSTERLRQDPYEAIEKCNVAHKCDFDDSNRERVTRKEVDDAKARLRAMSIVNVERLDHPPELPKDGVLTNDHIRQILTSLHNEGHLMLPPQLFEDKGGDSALFIKPLGDSAKGVYSGQLFFVGYNKRLLGKESDGQDKITPLYIVKETKKGVSEIQHLYQVSVSRLGEEREKTADLHFGRVRPTSPTIARIAFDDLHFRFNTNGKTRYFSLLQTAPGKSVNKHLREFGTLISTLDTDDVQFQRAFQRMKRMFFRIGLGMSELHQKYAIMTDGDELIKPTFNHGDLHSENIFYDDDSDTVTLIDNETFALSLHRPSIGVDDIVEFYLLHTMHTIAHTVASQLTSNQEFGINDALWHELWRSLFEGYLSAFGDLSKEEYSNLHAEFKKHFFQGLSQTRLLRSPRNFLDQRKLKRIGPTQRRSRIKGHELKETFSRLLVKAEQQYVISPKRPIEDL